MTSWAILAICSTSSSVSVGRPHMKYSFTCRQPLAYAVVTVLMRSSSDTILLMTRRIRSLPPSGANVRPERRPLRDSSLARSTLNASTLVTGQAQARLGALVAVGEALHDAGDLGVVGAGQRLSRPTSSKPVASRPWLDHLADALDGALPHRTGDHAGLAEAAAPGATAEDLHAHPLVHALRERHQRLLRVGPLVEVHRGLLGDPLGHTVTARGHGLDRAVTGIGDVVEAGHVHAAGFGQPQQHFLAAARSALAPSTRARSP